MTYNEIKEQYNFHGVRPAKKGELFIAIKNHGGIYDVCKASRDFKGVNMQIVKKRTNGPIL